MLSCRNIPTTSEELDSENHQNNERMKVIPPRRPVSDSCARVLSRLCREFRSSSTQSTLRSSQADSGHQSFQKQLALEHLQLFCGCQPTEAALLGSAWLAESSGTIVVPGDLLLNDCDGHAVFCNSERFARGELGGVDKDVAPHEWARSSAAEHG